MVQRGNDRRRIFGGDDDRRYFRHLVLTCARPLHVAVHAYVLMDNHVHLLLTPAIDGAVGRFMQSVGVRYVGWFNRRYGRTGTLWESRYRATLVDADDYLFACHRYIEQNPVRAGLVPRAGDFAWSSYRANAEGACEPLLEPHPLYQALGASPARRQAAYRGLFAAPLGPIRLESIRRHTRCGQALGGSAFRAQIAHALDAARAPRERGTAHRATTP
ncbi:MAG: transposase [Microcella pacifica]